MKISIAMATYNGAKYLQEQLDSFVSQTRLPDELVVCDDCSTDGTVEILKAFAEVAPFKLSLHFNEKNLGYTQNFGQALSLCTGDLVFLSDQDDIWHSDKLTTIEKLAIEDDYSQIFMNDAELVHADLSSTGLTKQGNIKAAGFSKSCFVMGCCMAIRKNFLEHLLPIPLEAKGHDLWLSKFGEGLRRRKITKSVLQLYRRHENNESAIIVNRTRKINRVDGILAKLNSIVAEIKKDDGFSVMISEISCIKFTIYILSKWLEKTNDKQLIKQLIEFKKSQQDLKQSLESRVIIRQLSSIDRLLPASILYYKGGYKYFDGFLSYLVDIII